MMKNNKWKLIASSVAILVPMIFGLVCWDRLPDTMNVHWGVNGEADGSASKAFAVFFIPLLLLAVHWICILFTAKDPKNKGQNNKVFSMVLWIMPVLSFYVNGLTYAVALGMKLRVEWMVPTLLGAVFTLIGNYMPKCRQNHTIGIKIKWTLEDEANWNATHRLAGKIWFICGIALFFFVFLPVKLLFWVTPAVVIAMVIIPMVYSYHFYKKQKAEGKLPAADANKDDAYNKKMRILGTVSLIFVALILIMCAIVTVTGSFTVQQGREALTIDAVFYEDLTVRYEDIDAVEYREEFSFGSRVFGFGSMKLLMGTFENKELGRYTLYAYAKSEACVLLKAGEKTLVIGCESAQECKDLYDALLVKCEIQSKEK